MEDTLQTVSSFSDWPMLVAIGIILLAIVAMSMGGMSGGGKRKRLRQLRDLRLEGSATGRFHPSHAQVRAADLEADWEEEDQSPVPVRIMAGIAASLPVLGQKDREKVRLLLHSAGINHEDALGLYVASKLISSAVTGLLAIFAMTTFDIPESNMLRLAGTLAATIFGGMVPELYVKRLAARREKNISRALPDALDLMVICTEAGLSLDPTVRRVARELRLSAPELAKELAIVSHELQVLPKRETALLNLADRNPDRSIRSLVTTLVQTMKYGTSLSHALRVLANESRSQRMLAAEERAAKLPAMMSLPLVCCMLPAVFLIIGGPAITQVMQIR